MWHHLCFKTNVGVITVGLHDRVLACVVCGALREDNVKKEKTNDKNRGDNR